MYSSYGPFCGDCGKTCKVKTVNNGLGKYEYWGFNYSNDQLEYESACCSASVFENNECTIEFEGDNNE